MSEAIESLRVAMLGTTDGDFLDPDAEVPAGEMFRLAAEWVEAHDAGVAAKALIDAADELAQMLPVNCELRPDGSEDPEAAAYVDGVRESYERVSARAAEIENIR